MAVTVRGGDILFNDGTTQSTAVGTAKAWVNFNGTGTVAIRAAFNVSSITDNGVGNYNINFTTALSDANYAISGVSCVNAAGSEAASIMASEATPPQASTCRILVHRINAGDRDLAYNFVQFFR